MPSDADIEAKFWSEFKSNPVLMIGLVGAHDAHAQPMMAFFEGDHGPVWFFTSKDNGLVAKLGESHHAVANYVAKGHGLFATLHGHLTEDTNSATVERFWNPHIAAWYPGGKTDPNLALLRLDTEHAQIWLNETTLGAAVKRLFGSDPKADYKDKVAEVAL